MEAQLEAPDQHISKRTWFADMTVDLDPALKIELEDMFAYVMETNNPLRSSTDLLMTYPGDPIVWLLRCRLVEPLDSDLEKELDLVGQHAGVDTTYYWQYRRNIVKEIGIIALCKELNFMARIIWKCPKNGNAWSHRQFTLKALEGNKSLWNKEEELSFCDEILGKDVCNAFVWNQRLFVVRSTTEEELMDLKHWETVYAIGAILYQPDNECPWTYLRHLHDDDMASLRCNYNEFYVSVLQMEMFLTPSLSDVPKVNEDIVLNRRACLHALNLILELLDRGYEPEPEEALVTVINSLYTGDDYSLGFSHKVKSVIQSLDEKVKWRGDLLNESVDVELFLRRITNVEELVNRASESRTSP